MFEKTHLCACHLQSQTCQPIEPWNRGRIRCYKSWHSEPSIQTSKSWLGSKPAQLHWFARNGTPLKKRRFGGPTSWDIWKFGVPLIDWSDGSLEKMASATRSEACLYIVFILICQMFGEKTEEDDGRNLTKGKHILPFFKFFPCFQNMERKQSWYHQDCDASSTSLRPTSSSQVSQSLVTATSCKGIWGKTKWLLLSS